MRIYVSQTRSADLIRRLWLLGIGECCVRGELPPRRSPWFYDNKAYADWKAGAPFDEEQFVSDMDAIWRCINGPEWIVLPDIVAGGSESLGFSRAWIHRCRGLAPLYLAVQDGMEPHDVDEKLAGQLAGLFVGGTLKWKIRNAHRWIHRAEQLGVRCHIGRVGTFTRTRWALRIGASSIDSALPLWSEENLQRFLGALGEQKQGEFSLEAP